MKDKTEVGLGFIMFEYSFKKPCAPQCVSNGAANDGHSCVIAAAELKIHTPLRSKG